MNIRQLILEVLNRRDFLKGVAGSAATPLLPSVVDPNADGWLKPDTTLAGMMRNWGDLHNNPDELFHQPEMHGIFHPDLQQLFHKIVANKGHEGIRNFFSPAAKAQYPQIESLHGPNATYAKGLAARVPAFIQKYGINVKDDVHGFGGLLNPGIANHMEPGVRKQLLQAMPDDHFDNFLDYHAQHIWNDSHPAPSDSFMNQVEERHNIWMDRNIRKPNYREDSKSSKVRHGRVKTAVTPSGQSYQVRVRRFNRGTI